MKKAEVPQDDEQMLEGKTHKVFYATDEHGNYAKVPSVGWEPENTALKQAWDIINEKVAEAKKCVLSGEASPLVYHMEKNQMDVKLLSQYSGIAGWRIKRHLKPKVFQKLKPSLLEHYAKVFNISVQELKNVIQ
ncbi:MAG: hypothetical protein COA57_07965 [Flavobacteriales bacterium]|nr:hypothetical protein [Bacteroidales bacterium AH-315-I05]PCJ85267.1 MAG: hypothetical protein COA57_07965 [Flavobacteriales bacterium]